MGNGGSSGSTNGNDNDADAIADAAYWAARGGRVGDLRAILDAAPTGWDPNRRCRAAGGRTPLMGAALADAWRAAELLLERGARLDAREDAGAGCTALMLAAQADAQATAGVLLHAGADPDAATDRDGQTALMWCCQADLVRMSGLLTAAGAGISRRRRDNATPLMLAARNDSAGAARLLLELGAPADDRGPAGFTALMICALVDAVGVARLLLGARADKGAADGRGWTALHLCAWHGSQRVARLLLEAGAETNTTTGSGGHTPATMAAAQGRFELLRLLADFGADCRSRCIDGKDIGQLAAASGCQRTADLAMALMRLALSPNIEYLLQHDKYLFCIRLLLTFRQSTDAQFCWLHTQAGGSLRPALPTALLSCLHGQQQAGNNLAEAEFQEANVPKDATSTSSINGQQQTGPLTTTSGHESEEETISEQIKITKRVVVKEICDNQIVSVKEHILHITIESDSISETVHVKGSDAAISALNSDNRKFRSTGSQFAP